MIEVSFDSELCFLVHNDIEQRIENYVEAVISETNTAIITAEKSFLLNVTVNSDFGELGSFTFSYYDTYLTGLENGRLTGKIGIIITDDVYNCSVTYMHLNLQLHMLINITGNDQRYDGTVLFNENALKKNFNVIITKLNDKRYDVVADDTSITNPLSNFWSEVHLPKDLPQEVFFWVQQYNSQQLKEYIVPRLNVWIGQVFVDTFASTDPSTYFQ